ncbi:aspartate/glutamate racemase family protein [Glaciecola sp. KUL10]|uniref:aspartate/glutamate racemase family protein n=1 Tax=Glaciecola sp. (strain KUL10) TaxID=2161813 RepID=UPI001F230450|nr:amino acid racemase [Glaciecola sp. KUL10]
MNKRPKVQRTIGILGGMSDKATAEYYRMINEGVNAKHGGWDIAEIVIQSVNFGNIEYFVREQKWDLAREYLEKKALLTEKGGADFLICASNTMHKVLDRLDEILSIPFIHISDPTGEAILKMGLNKVGLLGTKPVMEASFIKQRLRSKYNIEVIVPSEEDQLSVDKIIFDELVKSKISVTSAKRYQSICRVLQNRGAQAIIMGCTEIFLLLKQEDIPDLPLIDTTELHTKEAVRLALS